jgi:hypothetical protein
MKYQFRLNGGYSFVLKDNKVIGLEEVVSDLNRLDRLVEENLEKTADGVLYCEMGEADKIYCPKCGEEVDSGNPWVAYCWNCPNPDACNDIPLPLNYESCYADQLKAAEAAKRGK